VPMGPLEGEEERLKQEARAVRALTAKAAETARKALDAQAAIDKKRKAFKKAKKEGAASGLVGDKKKSARDLKKRARDNNGQAGSSDGDLLISVSPEDIVPMENDVLRKDTPPSDEADTEVEGGSSSSEDDSSDSEEEETSSEEELTEAPDAEAAAEPVEDTEDVPRPASGVEAEGVDGPPPSPLLDDVSDTEFQDPSDRRQGAGKRPRESPEADLRDVISKRPTIDGMSPSRIVKEVSAGDGWSFGPAEAGDSPSPARRVLTVEDGHPATSPVIVTSMQEDGDDVGDTCAWAQGIPAHGG
jgi:hypothetical protein